MQYSFVAILALAGAAFADVTITTSTTSVVTITSCAADVTNCPARTETQTHVAITTYPAAAYQTGGALYGAGSTGTGAAAYNKPSLTGYNGPSYTGAAGQVKAAGALAGVGAVAALLL